MHIFTNPVTLFYQHEVMVQLHQFLYLHWYRTNTSIFGGIRISQVYTNSVVLYQTNFYALLEIIFEICTYL